ncbi:TonB-dependent receptor [Desulfosarcina ovata]|uniref:TonB-dependent receptor n=1 Tax=Desulfosarcina ovata subsp. ovata TaxID=2752305 RepID=A0A5K8AIR9_9BACT|nr:TonB-dependent receptor [Desulfosarcina ovata]BBO92458.1 hypothetical protein DSCOOX_56380 [Desulfosarcina ovata subsp. ovata]
MKTGTNVKLFLSVVMASCILWSNVWAGSGAPEEETTVLETLIVTGSGQKTKLLDTNASIHVINRKDIENSGLGNTAELISSIPGVVNQKSSSQTYFSIRGTRSGMSGGPQIYVDGRPINVGVYGYSKIDSIPLDSIEKIEVIKSPSTAKYGPNAGRGVILITTRKGTQSGKSLSGHVSAEYGSWNTRKGDAAISVKQEQFDYDLSAFAEKSDGYRNDDRDIKNIDGRVGWQFDGGRIDWITGYNESFNKYPIGLAEWQVERDPTVVSANTKEDGSGYEMLPNESDEDLFNTILTLDYDKNDLLINSSVGFSRDHQDLSYNKYLNDSTKLDDNYEDDRVENLYDFKASVGKVFSGQSVSNTLTFGLDYRYSDFEQDRVYPYDTEGNNDDSEAAADIDAEKKMFGANFNHELSWNIFKLQSGLRYNYVSYDLTNRVPQSISVDYDSDIDWSISPSVNILDNANLFITWNHSKYYLPMGYYSSNMSYDNAYTRPEDLDPETYDTIEAGWKHQMSKAFNYSLILYYTVVDDKIVSYYEGTSFQGRRNAGTSIHKGVEVEIDGRPRQWIGYRLSFTTIDAEWDEGTAKAYATPDASSTSVSDLSGKTVNYVPEYEYTAGLDFYPFKDTKYGSLTIALDLRGFGKQYEDYNNNLEMSAADFLDAKITWDYKGFQCYLSGTNLFDKEWNRMVNATGKAHSRLTTGSGFYPQDGRYVGIGVAYKF